MAQLIKPNRLKDTLGAIEGFGQTYGNLRQLRLHNDRQSKLDAQSKLESDQRLAAGALGIESEKADQARKMELRALESQLGQADAGQVMGPSQAGDFQAGMKDEWAPLKDRISAKLFTMQGQPTVSGDLKTKREDKAIADMRLQTKAQQDAETHTSAMATDKSQRALMGAQASKYSADANTPKETAKDLPIDVKAEVGALSTKNASKISVANQIGSYLEQFKAAKSDDDKARIGGQMLKVLNSPEGADAIGVEEAKRLGDALEYNIFDVKAGLGVKPGNLIGRDLPGFQRQVQATYDAIKGSVQENRSEVGRLLGRPVSQPESARTTPPAGGMDRKSLAQEALNDPDATPEERAQAKRILGIP